jgi:hypothetical protein
MSVVPVSKWLNKGKEMRKAAAANNSDNHLTIVLLPILEAASTTTPPMMGTHTTKLNNGKSATMCT